MRVLFDTYAFRMQRVGGISRYFAELIRGLPTFGVTPTLFMPIVDNEHAESTGLSMRGSTNILSHNRVVRRGVHSALDRIDDLLRVVGRYDILHRTYYSEVQNVKRPAVCTVVDMIPDLLPEYFSTSPHQNKRQVAMASDLIFSISECTSRDIVSVYGLDPSRVVTAPLGINLSEFRVSSSSINPFRAPYVLFVGQRGGYKNFRRFAAALAPVLESQPEISLAVVGGGPLSEEEAQPFKATGTRSRVFQADVADAALPKIYREADVFVFPSEYEGFGIPLLEAFASGCPVAASRASCFPEVGGAAIEYFDPRSTDDISHATNRLLLSSARADELRALGAERVKLFTWTRTVALTAEGYRRLV